MSNELPNPESIDVKVGEFFEVKSIPLTLVGETSMLKPEFEHSKELKLLRTKDVEETVPGQFKQVIYSFEACKEGEYSVKVYFSHRITEEKWVPSNESCFKDKSEQTIQIKVTEIDRLEIAKRLFESGCIYCYHCDDQRMTYTDQLEENTHCSHCTNGQADQYEKFPFADKNCNKYLDVHKAHEEIDKLKAEIRKLKEDSN